MSRVIHIASKLFESIFVNFGTSTSFMGWVLTIVSGQPYLFLGAVLLIIGFSVAILKRIIHS